jgi:hypothetical protein
MKTMSISRLRAAAHPRTTSISRLRVLLLLLATMVLATAAGTVTGAAPASAADKRFVRVQAEIDFNLRACADYYCNWVGGVTAKDELVDMCYVGSSLSSWDIICYVIGSTWHLVYKTEGDFKVGFMQASGLVANTTNSCY